MRLPGATGQINSAEYMFDASGTITTGGTAQLVLPRARSRSSLILENISSVNILVEFGAARATATLTNGAVSAITVTNAGFGYTVAPIVEFLGGAYDNKNQITPTFTLSGLPEWPAPTAPNGSPAKAHCVMTGAAGAMSISSIVIDDPGKGYAYPPYIFIRNSVNDPYGCAVPSATSGVLLLANGGSYTSNGTICTTDQVAIFCATTGSAFTAKWTI